MIRINLLPSGRKKAAIIPPVFIYGIIGVVIVIIAIVAFTFHLNNQISAKQANINTKEQKLKQIEAALQDVKNLERDNEEYRKRTRIIEQLKKDQIVPLRLLDEVSELLPKGVWLVGMTDKGRIVSIEGYAFSNTDLVAYVQNLKGSRHLADVMLVESRQVELGEFSVYKFKLTFKM
jgi:Tfp pilus assembly protein PilN